MMAKRAERRAHYFRLKNRRKSYYGYGHYTEGPMPERMRGVVATTAALCSCQMCRNPRRSKFNAGASKLTLQERRHLSDTEEGFQEYYDGESTVD